MILHSIIVFKSFLIYIFKPQQFLDGSQVCKMQTQKNRQKAPACCRGFYVCDI